MLCRVEMPCNEQIFGRFYRWKLLHLGGGAARFGFIATPVLALLFALLMLGAGIPAIFSVLLLAAAALYYLYLLWLKPRGLFRQKPGAALLVEVTIFTPTGLTRTVRSEEGGLPENASAPYSALWLAAETGRDFYLFTAPTQAYMVDKAYFTNGSPGELRTLLRGQLGGRFRGPK